MLYVRGIFRVFRWFFHSSIY